MATEIAPVVISWVGDRSNGNLIPPGGTTTAAVIYVMGTAPPGSHVYLYTKGGDPGDVKPIGEVDTDEHGGWRIDPLYLQPKKYTLTATAEAISSQPWPFEAVASRTSGQNEQHPHHDEHPPLLAEGNPL